MARKTKGKTTKKIARKKVATTARGRRRTASAVKKPRASAPKPSAPKPAGAPAVDTTSAMNLLRAWSPSRYSTR
jgi:hypothetical protein